MKHYLVYWEAANQRQSRGGHAFAIVGKEIASRTREPNSEVMEEGSLDRMERKRRKETMKKKQSAVKPLSPHESSLDFT